MSTRVIPAPFTLEGWDPNLRTAIKGLEEAAIDSAAKIEDFVPRLLKAQTKSDVKFTKAVYGGMDAARQWLGKGPITPAGVSYLYDITATQLHYANGYQVTWQSRQWDSMFSMNKQAAEELGKTLAVLRQKLAFAPFMGALTSTWFDGTYLVSASHPWAPNSGLTGYQSNLATGAPTLTNLMTAFSTLRTMRDPMGNPLFNNDPAHVWVRVDQVDAVNAALNINQPMKSGTANNDRNPAQDYGATGANFVIGVPTAYWTLASTAFIVTSNNFEGYYSEPLPPTMLEPEKYPGHIVQQDMAFTFVPWIEKYTGIVASAG